MMDGMSTICMVPVFPLVILLLQTSQLRPPQRDKINQDAYLSDFHILRVRLDPQCMQIRSPTIPAMPLYAPIAMWPNIMYTNENNDGLLGTVLARKTMHGINFGT